MAGRKKPTAVPIVLEHTWADEVQALYLRSEEMEVEEFEQLLDSALDGRRPDHPGLPAYLPHEQYVFTPRGWKFERVP